jgi:LysM repeat protein
LVKSAHTFWHGALLAVGAAALLVSCRPLETTWDPALLPDSAPAVDSQTAVLVALSNPLPPGEADPGPLAALLDAPPALAATELAETTESTAAPETAAADAAAAEAAAPPPPLVAQVRTYRVQVGDSLEGLAARFGIGVETLRWANPLPDPNHILVGQNLVVLPVRGVLHTVLPRETLPELAARYGIGIARLIEANGIAAPYELTPGQRVLVPDGKPLPPAPVKSVTLPAPSSGERYRREFIEALVPAAQESQRRNRVPASVTLAQAIHESDWGTSLLTREANNLFGIKAIDAQGSAGTYWIDTWEVEDDEDVVRHEPFRAYKNALDSIQDHGQFFLRNSRYYPAFAYYDDARAFARAIADAGYASDPNYAARLIYYMDRYNLYQYDVR